MMELSEDDIMNKELTLQEVKDAIAKYDELNPDFEIVSDESEKLFEKNWNKFLENSTVKKVVPIDVVGILIQTAGDMFEAGLIDFE